MSAEDFVSSVPDNLQDDFDPYRIWLSIPKSEQPPHHYRLLGVSLFEDDARVIEEAADRQVAHLRNKQTSTWVAQAQTLLNEVATAAAVLLNAETKARYDEKLRAALEAKHRPLTAKPSLPQARELSPQQTTARAQPLPQQPAYHLQNPAQQTPHPLQPVPVGPQRPVPLQQQPLRPILVSPAAATPESPLIEALSAAASAIPSSKPVERPRREEKNAGVEILKVIIGGGAGLAIGAIVLAALGKSDFLYSLAGLSPPTASQNQPARPAQNNPNNLKKFSNPKPYASPKSNGGNRAPNDSSAGSTTTSTNSESPGALNPGELEPVAAPLDLKTTPAVSVPDISTASRPHRLRITQPTVSVVAQQSAATAATESLDFLRMVFDSLQKSVKRGENRGMLLDQLQVVQRLQRDPLVAEESELLRQRRNSLTSFTNVDSAHLPSGLTVNFSGRLLASMCITARPNAQGPQGRSHNQANPLEFAEKLLQYTDGMLALADDHENEPSAHDQLLYQAMVAQVLYYSYLRGNADQFSACVVLESLAHENEAVITSAAGHRAYRLLHHQPLMAAGLAKDGDEITKDPRTNFRVDGSLFARQADGSWLEFHPTNGAIKYREIFRAPAYINLMPDAGGTPVTLALAWSVTGGPAVSRQVFREGEWDLEKPSRSLVPKITLARATSKSPAAITSTQKPSVSAASQVGTQPSAPGRSSPSSPQPVAKRLWRHAGGFVELEDGVWHEYAATGDYFTLNLLSQTAESLEFERTAGAVRLRVTDTRLELSLPPFANFAEIAKGNWVTPLQDMDLDIKQQASLKKNCTTHADLVAKARKGLLTRFESSVSSVRNRVGKAEEKLALIAVLEEEQSRFEREGLVPWSTPMRTATAEYVRGLNAARNAVEQNFDRAIDFFLNHDQAEAAHAVLVLKQKTLAPVIIARVIGRDQVAAGVVQQPPRGVFGGNPAMRPTEPPLPIPPGLPADIAEQLARDREMRGYPSGRATVHRLWSNGSVDEAFGPSKWAADNTGLMLNIIRPSVSYRQRYQLADKGDEFAAQSTSGAAFNGTFAGVLEAYEKRPEVRYNPILPDAEIKPMETKTGDPATPPP